MSVSSEATAVSVNEDKWESSKMQFALTTILKEIILDNEKDENTKNIKQNSRLKFFNCKKAPQIELSAYIIRIIKYAKIEESTLINSLVYIDRICDLNNLVLSEFNVHRYIFQN
jgi:hypothetical protein